MEAVRELIHLALQDTRYSLRAPSDKDAAARSSKKSPSAR
jgi:hypothetical protein